MNIGVSNLMYPSLLIGSVVSQSSALSRFMIYEDTVSVPLVNTLYEKVRTSIDNVQFYCHMSSCADPIHHDFSKDLHYVRYIFHPHMVEYNSDGEYIYREIDVRKVFSISKKQHVDMLLENVETYPDMKFYEKYTHIKNFSMCLNVESVYLSKWDMEETFQRFGQYIQQCVISDNDGVSNKHVHLIPGAGRINWDDYFQLCEKYAPHATQILDVFPYGIPVIRQNDKTKHSMTFIRHLYGAIVPKLKNMYNLSS